jgi:hypothetical protein
MVLQIISQAEPQLVRRLFPDLDQERNASLRAFIHVHHNGFEVIKGIEMLDVVGGDIEVQWLPGPGLRLPLDQRRPRPAPPGQRDGIHPSLIQNDAECPAVCLHGCLLNAGQQIPPGPIAGDDLLQRS